MLYGLKNLTGFQLDCRDGLIGNCKDTLIDEENWVVRYLDVDTGHWLPGQRVLVSPISLDSPSWKTETIPTDLTKQQIENSPNLGEDAPVSRRWESLYYAHYGWPHYLAGAELWGLKPRPRDLAFLDSQTHPPRLNSHWPKLRSCNELIGYHVSSKNIEVGRIDDFAFEPSSWSIEYLIIETGDWFHGKKVALDIQWTGNVSWRTNQLDVDMDKDRILTAPEFEGNFPVPGDFLIRTFEHYSVPRVDSLF